MNRWTSGPTGNNLNRQLHRFDHRSGFLNYALRPRPRFGEAEECKHERQPVGWRWVAGETDTSRGSHAHVHACLSSLRPQPRFGEAEECGHIWGQNRAIGGMVSRARVAGLSIKHSTLHGDSLILDEEADNSGTGGGRACHFSPNPSSRLTMYNHGINHLNRQVLHSLTIRRPKLSTEFSLQGLTC